MSTKTATAEPTLAKTLAPEDVRVGDYVAVLSEEVEYPAFVWACDTALTGDPMIRVRFRPNSPCTPLRVKGICLPFLLVKPPGRKPRTIDVRAVQLARLDSRYARAAWKALR